MGIPSKDNMKALFEGVKSFFTAHNLWLYKATFLVDGWTVADDGSYTQTAAASPVDGGPALTASMNLSAPMTAKTTSAATNRTLQGALALFNTGTTTAGAATVTAALQSKPSCDIVVYWYAR